MWAVKRCKMQGLIPFLRLHPLLISTRLRVVYRQPQCHTQATENFLRLSFNICFRLKGKKAGSWTILQGFRKVKSYAHALFKWKRRKPGPKFSSPFHYTKFFLYLSICSLFIYWLSTSPPILSLVFLFGVWVFSSLIFLHFKQLLKQNIKLTKQANIIL